MVAPPAKGLRGRLALVPQRSCQVELKVSQKSVLEARLLRHCVCSASFSTAPRIYKHGLVGILEEQTGGTSLS